LARYQAGIRTEAQILDATRELLGEVGLDGTTLKAICDRAGVRSGSFYNLFDSKEDVIMRVVKDAIRAVDPHPSNDVPDSLDELVEAYITFVTGQPEVARVYFKIALSGASNGPLAERMRRHHDRRVARFSAAIARQLPELSDEDTVGRAEIILAALSGLAFMSMIKPELDFPERARDAAASVAALNHTTS